VEGVGIGATSELLRRMRPGAPFGGGRNAPPQLIQSILDCPLQQAVLDLKGWHPFNDGNVTGNLHDPLPRKIDAEFTRTHWSPKDSGA